MGRGVAAAALIALGAAAAAAAPAGAATRHYSVAAVPVSWNVIPNERDAIVGVRAFSQIYNRSMSEVIVRSLATSFCATCRSWR